MSQIELQQSNEKTINSKDIKEGIKSWYADWEIKKIREKLENFVLEIPENEREFNKLDENISKKFENYQDFKDKIQEVEMKEVSEFMKLLKKYVENWKKSETRKEDRKNILSYFYPVINLEYDVSRSLYKKNILWKKEENWEINYDLQVKRAKIFGKVFIKKFEKEYNIWKDLSPEEFKKKYKLETGYFDFDVDWNLKIFFSSSRYYEEFKSWEDKGVWEMTKEEKYWYYEEKKEDQEDAEKEIMSLFEVIDKGDSVVLKVDWKYFPLWFVFLTKENNVEYYKDILETFFYDIDGFSTSEKNIDWTTEKKYLNNKEQLTIKKPKEKWTYKIFVDCFVVTQELEDFLSKAWLKKVSQYWFDIYTFTVESNSSQENWTEIFTTTIDWKIILSENLNAPIQVYIYSLTWWLVSSQTYNSDFFTNTPISINTDWLNTWVYNVKISWIWDDWKQKIVSGKIVVN